MDHAEYQEQAQKLLIKFNTAQVLWEENMTMMRLLQKRANHYGHHCEQLLKEIQELEQEYSIKSIEELDEIWARPEAELSDHWRDVWLRGKAQREEH